jgi:hypothetical protein
MASHWFYRVFDQEMGPVGFQDLAELVRAGTLTEEDPVRREFSEEWIRAREVIGLSRAAGGPAAEVRPAEASSARNRHGVEPASPQTAVARALRPPDSAARAAALPAAAPRRRWRMPRIGVTAGAIAAIVLVVAAIAGYEVWSHRTSRVFPESALKHPRPVDRQTLETIRAARPQVPSVPGLKEGKPAQIPGLEAIDPGYSPCLSPDLKTIVYAAMPDLVTFYDLYVATRDDVTKPFGPPKLIRSCQSRQADVSPTLSPDGWELIFAREGPRPQFFHATRESASAEFGAPKLLKIPGYEPAKKQRVERPQFLDPLHIIFCFVDVESNVRKMVVAERSRPEGPFGPPQRMPSLSNAWPPWFLSANGLRAYYGTEEGLFVAARPHPDATFGEPIKILEASVTGPLDGLIWVAPQEDVVFYVSPGPGKKPGLGPGDKGRKLWMVRF